MCMRVGLVVVLLLSHPLFAQTESPEQPARGPELTVAEGVICKDVVDRMPVESDEVFDAGVGRLWCFTRITGAVSETTISHVWYFGDQKVHEQPLAVGASSWRTWSNKAIPAVWPGSWRVEVVSADGVVLASLGFTVQ